MKFRNLSLLILLLIASRAWTMDPHREITFDDIFRKQVFSERSVSGLRSMNDGSHYTVLVGGNILKYNYRTGDLAEILFSMDQLDWPGDGNISGYEFTQDDKKILLAADRERIYRHSYRANYYVYDLETRSAIFLSEKGKQQLGTFSPDGSKVAFVRENNLYIFDLETRTEQQLTFDGEQNKIINGAPDWVYEEEFALSEGFQWSPDSKMIAYYRTDETRVRQFSMTTYGNLYPDSYSFKYPKAGEQNAIVSIRVHHLLDDRDVEMDIGEETDQYIPRIKWTKRPDELSIMRLNRLQNKFDLLLADAATGESKVILTEDNEYFIKEASDDLVVYLDNGQHFIYRSEKSGFLHFYLYDMDGNKIGPITHGDWDVIDFLGMDEKRGYMYFTSYEESSVRSTVYRIRPDGTGKEKVSEKPGWNTAEFSKTFDYYIHTHSSVTTPNYITLHNAKGKLISVLEDNARLKENARVYGLPEKELFTITTPEGVELNAYMYKPKRFREEGEYPLMIHVYGGPESQEVQDKWGTSPWFYLLLEKGYVIACVDNRGTDGKGEAFRKSTYMQLGKLEVEDQIAAAKYLGSLPYVDASRIGITGGSYGGYMTSLCMTKGADVFKLGIAISPVTNWRYYDTIYTERFMRTPQENPDGYDLNSPVHYADRLKGKFLLIHGMADDNVHFQNSVDFAEALIQAGKKFDMMFYPDQSHGIYKRGAGIHLRTLTTDYVLENL
ncbi:MAG: peptidase S9 [Bacteroides sp. SM23_62]|nr:MAG: peptidase S9 [Bacteroides sp. SM23_62]